MNTRSILKVMVAADLLAFGCISYAVEDIWTSKTDMPTSRLGLSTSVVDGKIYAIGGGHSVDGPHSRILEEYDPVKDTWTSKSYMPTGRIGHAASVVDGKIYVIGGDVSAAVSCSTVEAYDPATDTWTTKADMPTKRTFLCTCTVDGKIYAIGGIAAPAKHTLSVVEVYDPATDTWTTKTDMPTPRHAAAASTVNGKIYVLGGVRSGRTVEQYDPATDTWTRKADMPTARMALSSSVVDGNIYAMGGASGETYETFKTVEEYDPAADMWATRADMPAARCFFPTSVVGRKIYAVGGSVRYPPYNSSSSVIQAYEPSPIVVDFNADEIVDFTDFAMLAQYWCRDESPCVGHIVDCDYLAFLTDYWLKEVLPFSLIAYWKLDETEGLLAHDSAGSHDGVLSTENPLWRPTSGRVNGALELDGIVAHISTPFVLNPDDGPFSVFAWVRGGDPGQVILSQGGRADWLLADSVSGALMTELKSGMLGQALSSQAVITDGDWHNVGLTWNKPDRILYVDYSEVARDTQSGVSPSDAGLNIGAGKDLGAGRFFTGLIDDVRIYNTALSAAEIETLAR